MGFWSRIFGYEQTVQTPAGYELVTNMNTLLSQVDSMSAGELYRTQPQLRTVVSFIARKIAQLGLHVYERSDDGGRNRVREGEAYELFKNTFNTRTDYELIYSLVSNLCIYDVAYWWIVETENGKGIVEIPNAWVVRERGTIFERPSIEVIFPGKHEAKLLKADEIVRFAGWAPDSARGVASPIEALRATLREQIQAIAYREQVWARGGRVSSVIVRPATAKAWSDEARKRFSEDWKRNWTGNGAKAGGTPILEEGMELKPSGFSPRENEWVDVAKLAQATVAAAYHVNPTMIGMLDNANYSNVKEFRKSLYGDSLGPTIKHITAHLNQHLLPILGVDNEQFYYEFNVAEQLQATPEEMAQVFSSSVGAPWLTRNEVRAMQNRPALPGGDELIVPLNVIEGGLASPRDTAPKSGLKSAPVIIRYKSGELVDDEDRVSFEDILGTHFDRQKKTIASLIGAGKKWWNQERWDKELAADLQPVLQSLSDRVGGKAAKQIGFKPSDYDRARTHSYITAVAESRSRWINDATKKLLDDALDELDDEESVVDAVMSKFESMREPRMLAAAGAITAGVSSFAATEAGRQLAPSKTVKTWIVNSGNPRPSHAVMDGEQVLLDEDFSNGMKWPGDPVGGADEVANCMCGVEIEILEVNN